MPNPIQLIKLRNNPDTQVIIVGELANGAKFLESSKGIMVGEFAVGGSNEFQSLFEMTAQQDLQNRLSMIKAVIDTTSNYFGSTFKMPDIRLKRIEQTRLTWLTSASPMYTIQILFLCIEQDDDVRKEVVNLQQAVYPIVEDKIVKPPIGSRQDGEATSRLTVSIGRWFQAVNMVIRDVQFTYSKELTSPGVGDFPVPLYAVGSVTFSPIEMPGADTVKSYFPGVL